MISKIDGVVLIVSDFERSLAFYRDDLGFKVKLEEEGYREFAMEGIPLSIMDLSEAIKLFGEKYVGGKGAGRRLELAAEVHNVDAVYENLKSKGVVFVRPPADQPWGQRTADFVDPDGNIWEIYVWTQKPSA